MFIIFKNKEKTLKLLVFICFCLSALFFYKGFIDPDTYWHIKTGEYISLNKAIPTKDIFSWYGIEQGLSWVNHEWLYDLIIYSIYKVFGLTLLNVFNALTGSVLFYLIYKFIKIRCANTIISVAMAMMANIILIPYVTLRPQVFSYCLLILLCILLEKKKWWWSIPIVVIGTNLHGGFYPMYLIMIAYYTFRYKQKPIVFIASTISVIINPYFFDIYTYTLQVQGYAGFTAAIAEWTKTQLALSYNLTSLFYYIWIIVFTHGTKISIDDAVLSVLIAIQTLTAQRNIVFLGLIIMPLMAPYIREKIESRSLYISRSPRKYDKAKLAYLLLFEAFFILIVGGLLINSVNRIATHKYEEEIAYPVKALQYIKENNLENVCNLYGYGGYLIFNDVKPLIDGRADIFAKIYNNTTLFDDYTNAFHLNTDYREFLKKYSIKYVLWAKDNGMVNAFNIDENLNVIYEDENDIIYGYIQ